MSKTSLPYEPHPYRTKNWPENSSINDLRDSLLSQGLLYPIKCCIEDGKRLITDGWMRLLLCVENNIPIRYDVHPAEQALDVIVGANFARHHWTKSQIAMFIAGKAVSLDGWSFQQKIDAVRKTYGIERATIGDDQLVRLAAKVRTADPDLADKVMKGDKSVSGAAKELETKTEDEGPNVFLKTIHQSVMGIRRCETKVGEHVAELNSGSLRDTKDLRTTGLVADVLGDRRKHDADLKRMFPGAALTNKKAKAIA